MKKQIILILLVAAVLTSCGGAQRDAPVPGKSMKEPNDSGKIDTVKATDSVIKG